MDDLSEGNVGRSSSPLLLKAPARVSRCGHPRRDPGLAAAGLQARRRGPRSHVVGFAGGGVSVSVILWKGPPPDTRFTCATNAGCRSILWGECGWDRRPAGTDRRDAGPTDYPRKDGYTPKACGLVERRGLANATTEFGPPGPSAASEIRGSHLGPKCLDKVCHVHPVAESVPAGTPN